MAEKRENIIIIEDPEKKDSTKQDERKRITGAGEQRLHAVSPEEAAEAVKEADAIRKKSRGVMEHDFKEKWLGKNREGGLKELADWTFSKLFKIAAFGVRNPEDLKKKSGGEAAYEEWKELIEPSLKRLAKEVAEIGAQEHVLQFFSEEWQPGDNTEDKDRTYGIWKQSQGLQEMEEIKNAAWQIWQDYSNK